MKETKSFSGTVKEELSRQLTGATHCQLAELASILHFCGNYSGNVLIQAENEAVLRKCFTLLKKTFNINTDIVRKDTGRSAVYSICLTNREEIRRVMQAVRFMDTDGKCKDMHEPVDASLIKNACCQRAFLRGAFLAAGSMSDPVKSYHLEVVCTQVSQAEQIRDIMSGFDVEARIVQRKKYQVVYMKDGSGISDFLNIIEAHVSLMDFENNRILKEMRNSVNRRVNCETANIGKTVSASTRQVEDILFLQERYGFMNLPDPLREMAEIRLMYQDAPLRELGAYLDPPVGKSGVNHRLRKLSELADKVRESDIIFDRPRDAAGQEQF